MFEITSQIMQWNPELQLQKNKVAEIEGKKAELEENLYNIWDDVRAKLWSEAPESFISAYISNQSKQIQRQIRTVNNQLMVEEAKLASYMDDVEQTLDAFYKWMQMDAEIEKERLKAEAKKKSWWSWSWYWWWGSWWVSWWYDKIYNDMVNWSFGGSYSQTAMKRYWYWPVGKDQVLTWIGANKSLEEIESLNWKIPADDIDKIEEAYFVNKMMEDPVQALKEVKDKWSDADIHWLIDTAWLSEDEAIEAMKEAWYSWWFLWFWNRRKQILNADYD